MKKLLLMAFMVMMALALMAPAALAQDDLDDGDGDFDDDDDVAAMPSTGGPVLLPLAGVALLGAGAVGVGVVRRNRK